MLKISQLQALVGEKKETILHGVTLEVPAGAVHAIMGPNGAGKSTLAHVLAGKPGYDVTGGTATLDGADILDMGPAERAQAGLFLAFQYPVELPGVNTAQFLRTALNAQRTARGEDELDGAAFLRLAQEKLELLAMNRDFLKRDVNAGFSGGEKKRFEILQMALLEPKLCLLDETDSGLDIDALKIVAGGVNALRAKTRGFLIITHYQRLLDYVEPDMVHIMAGGKIVKSGSPELAKELEAHGYDRVMAA
jgi:Fe-S cluster assembly ATP-binding protein